jgi:hypothetical protein
MELATVKGANHMKHQIARFSILQTAKIATIMYAIAGLLLVPFGCVLLFLPSPSNNPTLRITGIVYLFGPLLEAVIGFIFTVIGCWIYNLLAPRIGGVEFELKEIGSSTPSA